MGFQKFLPFSSLDSQYTILSSMASLDFSYREASASSSSSKEEYTEARESVYLDNGVDETMAGPSRVQTPLSVNTVSDGLPSMLLDSDFSDGDEDFHVPLGSQHTIRKTEIGPLLQSKTVSFLCFHTHYLLCYTEFVGEIIITIIKSKNMT